KRDLPGAFRRRLRGHVGLPVVLAGAVRSALGKASHGFSAKATRHLTRSACTAARPAVATRLNGAFGPLQPDHDRVGAGMSRVICGERLAMLLCNSGSSYGPSVP